MAELPERDDAIAPDNITGLSAAVPFLVDEEQLSLAERCLPVTTMAAAVRAPFEEFEAPRQMHFEADRGATHDGAGPVRLKECSSPTQEKVSGVTQVQADKAEKAMPSGDLEAALQCETMKRMISACNEADEIMESAHGDSYGFARQPFDEPHENFKLEIKKNVLFAHSSPSGAVSYDSGPPFKVERTDNQAIETSSMGQDGNRLAVDSNLEEMRKLATEDVSTVDSVISNLFKVSIQQNVVSFREHKYGICGNALENCKHSESQSLDWCRPLLGPSNETSQGIEPPQKNAEVTETQFESCSNSNKLCLIKEDCIQYTEKDAIADNNDNANVENDNEMKEVCGDLNEEVEQDPEDSVSSSSTSTLSFSLSRDDEEANNFCHSNNFNQQCDIDPESECEEGELKESPSRRKKMHAKKIAMAESSDEEEGIKEPPLSRSKTKDLPPVPKVSVILQPHHTMVPAGLVSSIVGVNLIVEAIEGQQPLTEGSVLWLTGQQSPLGAVDELFGPVKKPFYVVRYNEASEVPKEAKEGAQVAYVRDFVDFVLNNPDLYAKGYDNVGEEGEELSDSEVYFSDDEKEAEYKSSRSRRKRGSLEPRTLDNTTSNNTRLHEERKAQGKRSARENRNQRLREVSGGPPKHQMSLAQRRQCKRDLPFRPHQGDRELPLYQHGMNDRESSHSRGGMKPMQKCNDRQFEDLSSVMHALPKKPVGFAQRKSLALPQHCVSMSDHVCVASRKYQSEDSPRSFSNDAQPTLSNHSSQATSWEPLSPQTAIPMDQAPDYLQGTSHKLQMQGTFGSFGSSPQQYQGRLAYSPLQSRPQPQDLYRPYSFMQLALPQQDPLPSICNQGQMSNQSPMVPLPQAWHVSSPHAVSRLSGVQHPQVPAGNTAMVVGQVSQVAGIGYSVPLINDSVHHSVADTGQGMLPIPPVFQQQAPLQTQFASLGANQGFTSVSSHVNMQIANQVQATQMDGYPLGVQSTDFSVPVLGIPVGRAEISPSNYRAQNQHYSGFNQHCAPYLDGPPLMHGVPDNPGSMQPPSLPPGFSAVPGHQQRSHQDGFGQNPYRQRPPYQGSSSKNRRF